LKAQRFHAKNAKCTQSAAKRFMCWAERKVTDNRIPLLMV
jgi:hypothetical protein